MLDVKNGVNEKFVEENMCPIGLASHLLGDKWIDYHTRYCVV